MEKIGGYMLLERLGETRRSALYRAKRMQDDAVALIKFLHAPQMSAADVARLKKEFESIKQLDIEGIVKPYELLEYEDGFALVMQDTGTLPLKEDISPGTMEVHEFLDMAAGLTETVGRLHESAVVHGAIKPSNILAGRQQTGCKITDFGALSLSGGEHDDMYSPEVVSTALPYMAPEQTGRMNRTVDRRTDLYCLGAVFYEMLTGRPPFVSQDPMEIIHSHIARLPVPPFGINNAIPGAVSDIVMKLLFKEPRDRYQSAYGLLADLLHCRRELAEKNEIEPFALGKSDISLDFNAAVSIVGRQEEAARLLECYDRMMERKTPSISIVNGPAGSGKSALVNEVCSSVTAGNGYFITGKYDKFRGEVPYSALIQAFMSLVSRILAEGPERIESWRIKIQAALGSSGKVVTEVIPNLELIVGQQPEVPDLGLEAARNRFAHVFIKFVRVFARPSRPLVLFLDNLQWADRASLRFLGSLAAGIEEGCMWMVLACRDGGRDEKRSLLKRMFREIRDSGKYVDSVDLKPFSRGQVNMLVSDLLRIDPESSGSLAGIVFEKTGGNPFFANQFMQNLYENRFLRFDPGRGWYWDEDRIRALHVTDNVVEMTAEKIADLPAGTRQVLKAGACIGNRFDLGTLAEVLDTSLENLLEALVPARKAGFLQFSDNMWHFPHDRLWEAAYSLLSVQEKSRIHRRIGWHMYRRASEEELYRDIFYIVNHLNKGRAETGNHSRRNLLARLNLVAGRRAKDTVAYQSMLTYMRVGIGLLNDDPWDNDYQLALELHTEAAKAAYLNADFEEMEARVRTVTENAATVLDSIDVWEIEIQAYLAQRRIVEAVDTAYMVLGELGIKLPRSATAARRRWEFAATQFVLHNKNDEQIVNYRLMEDPVYRAAVRIATSAMIAFYIGGYSNDVAVMVLRMLRICFRRGVCEQTPHWLASYSVMLFALNRLDEAFRFGELAIQMAKRLGSEEIRTRHLVNAQLRHWRDPLDECCRAMRENYERSFELGDVDYSAYSAVQCCHMALCAGRELEAVAGEAGEYSGVMRRYGQMVPLHLLLILEQVVENLRGEPASAVLLTGGKYDEEAMVGQMEKSSERVGLFLVYTYKLFLCYILGEHERAGENAEKAKQYLDSAVGLPTFCLFYFYRALNYLAIFDSLPSAEKKAGWKKIEHAAVRLRLWAKHGAHNHGHKKDLVEAEMARVRGDLPEAGEFYHRAASEAGNSGFLHEEALACELAGLFYAGRKMTASAGLFMHRALNCYQRWGALAKVRQLEENHAKLFRQAPSSLFAKEASVPAGQEQGSMLDLSTVIKAVQAISGEIVLEQLLDRLIRIGIENAGGQRGIILLEENGRLYAQAESDSAGNVKVLKSVPFESYGELPASIVSYVYKTLENVVIDDAGKDERFASDPYIREKGVRSVLCAPIRRHNWLSGLFYVENSLAAGVFTRQRMELLTILSAPSAIAIENAKLFEMARRDGLTGLINYRYFLYSLEKELAIAGGNNSPVALLMLDIDHFKQFNDRYGHQAGDEVLKQVAAIVRSNAPDGDLVSRYGGEEFTVICPGKTFEEAKKLAEKIRLDVECSEMRHGREVLKAKVSIGVAGTFLAGAASAQTLIRMADSALYKAKAAGRNRVAAHA